MKKTLSTYEAVDYLFNDENGGWSRAGSLALIEYLEELESDTGEEYELDVVALRCDYSEYKSLHEWAREYFTKEQYLKKFANSLFNGKEERDNAIREYIQDHGQLIEFNGGIIVSSF